MQQTNGAAFTLVDVAGLHDGLVHIVEDLACAVVEILARQRQLDLFGVTP